MECQALPVGVRQRSVGSREMAELIISHHARRRQDNNTISSSRLGNKKKKEGKMGFVLSTQEQNIKSSQNGVLGNMVHKLQRERKKTIILLHFYFPCKFLFSETPTWME